MQARYLVLLEKKAEVNFNLNDEELLNLSNEELV